ncbi:sensor histidine kinase [Corynebacterium lizhenjunii]|uniref:Oxygen sensor histidine kinase NreB n=1 Tax=Corynebacterium lizhenjunii TaxID=2709394 RepID=A0A7T0KFD0_9CORY|nr:sensor histidine kinase [Corynebacterium lizhenjunii]QPK79044.1 sensor histidine kinase [Corynebacterium lizhenjunii]
MDTSLTTESDAVRNGVHILTAALLVVAIFTSVNMPMGQAVSNLMLLSTFAIIYFGGWGFLDRWGAVPKLLWLTMLTVLWFAAMLNAPAAMYLVFSLYFLYLFVIDDWRGIILVLFATALAIGVQLPTGLTFGGVMGPAVSGLVTVAIHYTFKALAKVTQELKVAQGKLAESEHNAGVIAERQRIAHEIHDTLAQGLSSIQMLLHAADRDLDAGQADKARGRIELARKTAAENLQEARAMIAALQPAALAQTSLAQALERMTQNFASTSGIDMDVEVEGQPRQLPMKVEAALLRVAQGAVGNVVKHSGASRARVTVTYQPQQVRVDVVDNGAGFDPEAVRARPAGLGHIGLSAMRRRAAELGGQLEVESHPGGGTAVMVSIPVDAATGSNPAGATAVSSRAGATAQTEAEAEAEAETEPEPR